MLLEIDFQRAVLQAAALLGWRCAHFRPARLESGAWATPVSADAGGFPDLVLAHPEHGVIFAELKTDRGRVSPEQQAWIDTLEKAGARIHVWRPARWTEITATLAGR